MNRPKMIGTRGESAVVRVAREMGFLDAERLALSGANDQGDIRLCSSPLVILEVKSGKAAQDASWSQIQTWIKETMRERDNAWRKWRNKQDDFHGFLVTQRRGYGVERAGEWCLWTLPDDPVAELELGITAMFPLAGFLWMMKERWSYAV